MSTIGTVDCGFLATYQGKAAQLWVDPISKIDHESKVDAANAVIENQKGQVKVLDVVPQNKKRIVSVEWLQKCNIATTACTDDCTITGEDADPICKEYELDCLRETTFKLGRPCIS